MNHFTVRFNYNKSKGLCEYFYAQSCMSRFGRIEAVRDDGTVYHTARPCDETIASSKGSCEVWALADLSRL